MLKYVKVFRNIIQDSTPSERSALASRILEGIIKDFEGTPNESDKVAWAKSITRSDLIGLTCGVEWLDAKSKKLRGFAFNSPALLINDKRYPALWIMGPEITDSYREVPIVKSPDVRDRYSWVNIMKKATTREMAELMQAIFKAQELFRAKWKSLGPIVTVKRELVRGRWRYVEKAQPRWELVSKNPVSVEFSKDLRKNKSLEFMGFCTHNAYYRIYGDKTQLEAEWLHALSGPALLYRHKNLPLYLVAGFDIMFNNSIVGDIAENSMNEKLFGITG